jgi:hypothetical protein
MNLIQPITDDTLQTMNLVLPDGTSFSMTIYFVPMQYGWFITNLTYAIKNFEINGLRITNNPNMLYQFKNKIPFGLGCFSSSSREPTQQQDFSSGSSKLYLLNADEIQELVEFYSQ